jgi:hypothetical protein
MTNLLNQLTELARTFADSVVAEIRGASVQDLLAEGVGGGRSGSARPADRERARGPTRRLARARQPERLPRRSPEDVARAVDLVTKLLRPHPKGMRAEEIRKMLGLEPREMPRVLKAGLAQRKLKSQGQRRATTYFAA